MQQYLDLMRRLRSEGARKTDRTGTGTLSVFGHQMRFDLCEGFPLVTTKKLHLSRSSTSCRGSSPATPTPPTPQRRSIWMTGPMRMATSVPSTGSSGAPGRSKGRRPSSTGHGRTIDQIQEVVETLRTNPDSRRMIDSAWNPADIPDMALAPCH
jgi:thymidylate synthase